MLKSATGRFSRRFSFSSSSLSRPISCTASPPYLLPAIVGLLSQPHCYSSVTGIPISACLSACAICSSVKRLFRTGIALLRGSINAEFLASLLD
jgi:hypothetical protein